MHRPATSSDFEFIYNLYMHPKTNPWLLYEKMDPLSFDPIFTELISRKLVYIFSTNGLDAGMFKLVPQKYRNSHIVYLGGVAIDPVHAGKGLGRQMLEEIVQLASDMNFKRIELTVATANSKAIRLYESAGFIFEGTLRNYSWLKAENRFIDEQVMAKLF